MSSGPASLAVAPIARPWHTPELRHAWQLLAAVVLSYSASLALGLPESLWAVMSALIVVRPTTGSSLGVGWQRVQGTVLGALFALGGVWLHHAGLATPVTTLGIVGALAFGSALVPALRSAPITALIVLGGVAMAGHSALQVALLRVGEISIGVAVGLAVSLFGAGTRAAGRFDAECAVLLRRLALDLEAPNREAAGETTRAALRELAVLAEGADREERWAAKLRRRATHATPGVKTPERRHRRAARLLARMSADLALFGRLSGTPADAPLPAEVQVALRAALNGSADRLEGRDEPDLQPLRQLALQWPWAGVAVKLMLQDLGALAALRAH